MVDLSDFLCSIFILFALFYIVYLKPKYEKKRHDLLFDNRVLGFVDAVYFMWECSEAPGFRFYCSNSQLRDYIRTQLEKAHSLPDTKLLIRHTVRSGYCYSSHIGLHGEHTVFALLCMIQYAKETDNDQLLYWCESHLALASKNNIQW